MTSCTKFNKLIKDIEDEDRNFDLENQDDADLPVPASDLLTDETMRRVLEEKEINQSKFISHWEADEQDIQLWTKKDLNEDPGKRFISFAEDGNLVEMKKLMNSQPDFKAKQNLLLKKDSDGYTALHRACYSNNLDVVKYLISFEDDPNMPDVNQLQAKTDMGWTPLHSASYWNCFVVVDYLLRYANADVNIKTNSGQTCLHLAAQQSHGRETLLILLAHPLIKYDIKNDQEETAQNIAIRSCKYNALFEITEPNLNKL